MEKQDQWTSRLGFILATAGSAIGLGAIWKFPYMTGTNGGSVFFLLFIVFTLLIGLPILLAEFIIGRKAQADAVTAYRKLAPKTPWIAIGYIGTIVSFILLSFYSVVGGWILSYLWRGFAGMLSGKTEAQYGNLFDTIISNSTDEIVAQLIFMIMTIVVVQGGISKGIERASRYMMPALFIMFLVLVVRSLTLDGAMEGVRFLLKPDWSYLTPKTALLALGQAFFALSVGVSVMVTYASYLSKRDDMAKSALSVSALNIVISLLAGLVIFPAVFALGFKPDAGPGLIFIVLPAVFNQITFGGLFLVIFLILLLFATLTSAFSILEILVSVLTKERVERRKTYSWIAGLLVFAAGIPSALSFGVLSDVKIMGKSFFDFADFLTSTIGLPLGALLIALFVSFKMNKSDVHSELVKGSTFKYSTFQIFYFMFY